MKKPVNGEKERRNEAEAGYEVNAFLFILKYGGGHPGSNSLPKDLFKKRKGA
jgi:hypothetical protein